MTTVTRLKTPALTSDDRLDRLEALIAGLRDQADQNARQLGFSLTVVAAQVGALQGEMAPAGRPAVIPRRPARPRRARHLRLVG